MANPVEECKFRKVNEIDAVGYPSFPGFALGKFVCTIGKMGGIYSPCTVQRESDLECPKARRFRGEITTETYNALIFAQSRKTAPGNR